MLTEIQRDAIAHAKRGDYSLLDAMELDHRIRTGQCVLGYRLGGRLRFVIEDTDAQVPCIDCEGEGGFDNEEPESGTVRNLDGDVLYRIEDPADEPDPTRYAEAVGKTWCDKILTGYRLAKAAEAQAEAAKPPLAAGATRGQQNLIPENL